MEIDARADFGAAEAGLQRVIDQGPGVVAAEFQSGIAGHLAPIATGIVKKFTPMFTGALRRETHALVDVRGFYAEVNIEASALNAWGQPYVVWVIGGSPARGSKRGPSGTMANAPGFPGFGPRHYAKGFPGQDYVAEATPELERETRNAMREIIKNAQVKVVGLM